MIEHTLVFAGAFLLTLAGIAYVLADGISFDQVRALSIFLPTIIFTTTAASCLVMGIMKDNLYMGRLFADMFLIISIPYQKWSTGRRWNEWFEIYKLAPNERASMLRNAEGRYRRQAASLFTVGALLTMFGAVAAFVSI